MSLLVRNLQRKIKFDVERLRRDTGILVKLFQIEQFDLGVICVGGRKIQKLNETYRGVKGPTDVLSFPYHEVSEK